MLTRCHHIAFEHLHCRHLEPEDNAFFKTSSFQPSLLSWTLCFAGSLVACWTVPKEVLQQKALLHSTYKWHRLGSLLARISGPTISKSSTALEYRTPPLLRRSASLHKPPIAATHFRIRTGTLKQQLPSGLPFCAPPADHPSRQQLLVVRAPCNSLH
ncbi:uncharacterized protein B0T15DRAFT_127802 [Chaetomium strumarium]|uniref:Uncharacterized protein n=1 Tax=Chaetomium strumarium TaxID=1170767 RepID=A0AAJ0M4Z8_9PEZI|nr:hypothetical protein B0T15DRAFT_127802 [Chaetomium strumarium]